MSKRPDSNTCSGLSFHTVSTAPSIGLSESDVLANQNASTLHRIQLQRIEELGACVNNLAEMVNQCCRVLHKLQRPSYAGCILRICAHPEQQAMTTVQNMHTTRDPVRMPLHNGALMSFVSPRRANVSLWKTISDGNMLLARNPLLELSSIAHLVFYIRESCHTIPYHTSDRKTF